LSISYNGANYHGWQKQNKIVTVQNIIEDKLRLMFSKKINTVAASRTDVGVHALDQKVCFEINKSDIKMPIEKIYIILNKFLPNDIFINKSQEVSDDFQVRFDVQKKTYLYIIYNSKKFNILFQNFSWQIKNKLDIKKIKSITNFFVGKKDFRTFCASNSLKKNTIREIFYFDLKVKNKFLIFEITGNGFLYHMIRIIIALIIDFSINKRNINDIEKIIELKDRKLAQKVAPAQGLILKKIQY
jgi:tRNA pseudouridine38-40 synthase